MDYLPPFLQTLHIDGYFSYPVDHLPPSLKRLTVTARNFNYSFSLDNLPPGLIHLHFKLYCSDRPLDHLPPSLQVLSLVIYDHQPSFNHLPPSITELYIKSVHKYTSKIENLPPNLSRFCLIGMKTNLPSFPDSITHLRLDNFTLQQCLPNLTHVIIDHDFNYPLPPSVIYLEVLGGKSTVSDFLPPFLQTLIILGESHPIKVFPPSLIYLWIHNYSHPLDNLPHGLKSLRLGYYNQSLSNLPSSLTQLQINNAYHQLGNLPPNITQHDEYSIFV